jgi:uncharacterized protein (UPF0333 family)
MLIPDMKRKRGQSTIEFTVLFSFMILMFSVFFVLIGQKLVELRTERSYEILKELKNIVENEVELARIAEDGYMRSFRLPFTVDNINYNISIVNNTELVITIGDKETFAHLPENVSGNIDRGTNNITKNDEMIMITPG